MVRARDLPGRRAVMGHGDRRPWNILARDRLPVAFIDWDHADPIDAVWELAEVAWLNAQLHGDDVAAVAGLAPPEDRRASSASSSTATAWIPSTGNGFIDRLVEMALRSARDEAVEHAVRPGQPGGRRLSSAVGRRLAGPFGRVDPRPPPPARTALSSG